MPVLKDAQTMASLTYKMNSVFLHATNYQVQITFTAIIAALQVK